MGDEARSVQEAACDLRRAEIAVAPLRARGEVSQSDADRFAGAMADMRFLFDKELESFVGGIYGALLKSARLMRCSSRLPPASKSPEDKELTEMAEGRSRELSHQISDAIDRDMPKRNEKFMYPGPVL
jgi:hypothetical protein